MAKNVWKISEETVQALRNALDNLSIEIADLRSDEFDTKSERWQQGDKGQEVEQWLQELDDYCDELETAINSVEDASELGDKDTVTFRPSSGAS